MKKTYFTKGKRSTVYLIKTNSKTFILKQAKPQFKKQIQNEAKWLKVLNKKNIGPKLIKNDKNSITMQYIKGKRIIDFLKSNNKTRMKSTLKNILNQCRTLDKLKINKKEMQNPYKHIIINKNPIMIDFERCHKTQKPKNTTQFFQFITSKKIQPLLKTKKVIILPSRALLKKYKKRQTESNFKELLKQVK